MKGIVKQVQSNGSLELKHGLFYKYEVTIEANGKELTGEYLSKSNEQTKFVVGDSTEFEYTDGKWPKIKPASTFEQGSYTPKQSNPDRDAMIVKQSSLKCATDLVIANGGDLLTVIETAEALTDWVLDGKKPSSTPTNDMPF